MRNELRFVVLFPIWEFLYSCLVNSKVEEIGIFQSLLYFEKWCCVKCGLVNHLPVKDLWKAIRVFEVIHLFGEITAFETIWIISCLAAIYPHANYPIYQNPSPNYTIYTHTPKNRTIFWRWKSMPRLEWGTKIVALDFSNETIKWLKQKILRLFQNENISKLVLKI